MATKKQSPKTAAQMSAGNKPEFKSPSIDDDAKLKAQALLEASRAREERIANFASAHNSLSVDTGSLEEKLESRYSILEEIEDAIDEKTQLLKSSGKINSFGQKNNLSGLRKAKIRNEVRNLKTTKTMINGEVSQLERNLTGSFRRDSNRIDRSKVRKNAKKNSYHKKYSGAIEKAITKTVKGFSPEKLSTLKAEVTKADQMKGDALLMQALLKAPRHLQTKVVANPDARKLYMQHFRSQLKVGKK